MGYLKLIFPAFLLICQISLPISASSEEIDPNELLLQKLREGSGSSQFTTIRYEDDKLVDVEPVAQKGEAKQELVKVKTEVEKPKGSSPKASSPRAYPIVERVVKKAKKTKIVASKSTPQQTKAPEAALPQVADVEAEAGDLSQVEPAAGSRRAITWFSSLSNGQRMTITFDKRPNLKVDEAAGEVILKFDRGADYNPPLISKNFVDNFRSIEKLEGKNLAIRIKLNPDLKKKVSYNSRRVFIDLIDNAPEETVKANGKETPPQEEKPEIAKAPVLPEVDVPEVSQAGLDAKKAAELAKNPVPEQKPQGVSEVTEVKYISYDKNIVSEKAGDKETYEFKFQDKTDAALFERFGSYWLVFYTQDPIGLPNIENSKIFTNVEKIPHRKAAIYKWDKDGDVFASAERNTDSWTIKFDKLVETPVKFPLSLKKDGEEWYVNVPGIDSSIDVKDDFTSEILTIFPSRNAGEGFASRVIYRDFVVEKSNLGIVLRKISEDSIVTFSKNQLRLTPSAMPRKLYAQEGEDKGEYDSEALINFQQIAMFSKSLEGDMGKNLLSDLAPEARGKTLFARKFYREAAVDLGSKVGFDNGFMSAAAYFLAGRYKKVVDDLERIDIPLNKDVNEFTMWLIAARQELHKQDPRAKVSLEIPDSFSFPKNLKYYPVDIATAIRVPIAEAAINTGKTDYAESVLNDVSKNSSRRDLDYVSYLRGRIKAAQGSNENAIEIWDNLSKSTDSREVKANAIYAKVTKALELGKIDEQQAIDELEPVRIMWRGGEIEFNTLFKIAELYSDSEQYGKSLLAYKTALSAIPFHPKSDEITANMREVYKLAMQKDFKDPKKSFDTLTLYYDYIELKPTGREGEYMTIELAERLVGFDLIQEAADVLEDFVKNVRDIEERALINTRIAILYYMLRQPEKSLAKLAESESQDIPRYIQWQHKVLFVRILSEEGKYDEALSKVTRIPPQQASELRAEIYWFKQDWEKFITNFNKMNEKSDINIMKAAIAYSMLNDDKALTSFRSANSETMKGSKYETAFNFITQKNTIDYRNLSQTVNLDFAKKVIDDYKQNLRLTGFFDKEVASN